MIKIRPAVKWTVLAVVALFAAYVLAGWLILPSVLRDQAQKFLKEKTGHQLEIGRVEFNPLALDLRLGDLRLARPDGQLLLTFSEFDINVSLASLVRRALVFDAVELRDPEVHVALDADGRLNWMDLVDSFRSKETSEPQPPAALPRLDIMHFVLASGHIEFSDHRHAFSSRVDDLSLDLSNLSTLPDDKGRYRVTAHTSTGAGLSWQGEFEAAPLAASGELALQNIDLARLTPYFKAAAPASLPLGPVRGQVDVSTGYHFAYGQGRMDLDLQGMSAKIRDLGLDVEHGPSASAELIEARDGQFNLASQTLTLPGLSVSGLAVQAPRTQGEPVSLLRLGHFDLEQLRLDLARRQLALAKVALKDGHLGAVRDAHGDIDVLDAVQALKVRFAAPAAATPVPRAAQAAAATAGNKAASAPAAAAWHFQLDQLQLSNFEAGLRDDSVEPAARLDLQDVDVLVSGLSDDLAKPVPARVSFKVSQGGRFDADVNLVPAGPRADFQFRLADLALAPAQPYLSVKTLLRLTGGQVSVQGKGAYGRSGVNVRGGFDVRDLRLVESGNGAVILAWRSVATHDLQLTASSLNMGELSIKGLNTKLEINKDKTVNVGRILRKPAEVAPQPGAPSVATSAGSGQAAGSTAAPATPFGINIDRLRISASELDFADQSLALPFGVRIHDLAGAINGLSNRPGAPGQLEIDGQVDDYGLARAVGQIDLFNPGDFTDIKVVFRNVEMTRLSPYSATFAGRKIESGKLSLDLEYKVKKRQLEGDNKVVIDKLVLGERVESPEAKNLPLDLAIAILQDSDGRIDLGLPVSGSLDDPQFSYGSIVWKAILNVLTKVATAPFRALASLFGGSEKFENVAFEAGDPMLTPPEKEKVVQLATALQKRPALAITVHGVYAEADRSALQDRQLRRAVALKMGLHLQPQEDPGPLSTRDPKVQSALESLFAERLGADELSSMREGYRQANPGQMEQGLAGKMMSRLSGVFEKKRTLSDDELGALKGADFYAVLYDRLRAHEAVDDAQLLALAQARAESVLAVLQAAGAPAQRAQTAPAEKVETDGRDIPVKLVLGTAAAPAASPPPAAAPATAQ